MSITITNCFATQCYSVARLQGCSRRLARTLASATCYPRFCECRELWLCFDLDPFSTWVQQRNVISHHDISANVQQGTLLTWPPRLLLSDKLDSTDTPACRSPLDTVMISALAP